MKIFNKNFSTIIIFKYYVLGTYLVNFVRIRYHNYL